MKRSPKSSANAGKGVFSRLARAFLPLVFGLLLTLPAWCADTGALKKEELDTDKDGQTDKIVYTDADGRVVRQVWNVGKPEGQKTMVFHYDGKTLKSAEIDSHNTGKTDIWIDYKDGFMSVVRRDSNGDGKPDFTGYYQGGVLEHSEVDANHDGKVDHWFYYVGNQVTRAEEDTNGDGKPDKAAAKKKGQVSLELDTNGDGKVDQKSI